MKRSVIRNFTKFIRKQLYQSLRPATLLKKTLAQVLSCEFCEISKNNFSTEQLWMSASEFVIEMLIFRSSHSQTFSKIGVLKNCAILEPLSNKVAGLLLQNTRVDCFWLFVHQILFLELNMVFIADSRTGFCSRILRKHELSLTSSHSSWSVAEPLGLQLY